MKPLPGTREYTHIITSVRRVVKDIIAEIFSCDDSYIEIKQEYISKHVELVGSCKEGSKVRRPDEFDFSVIMPHFSADNVVVEHGSNIQPAAFMCIHKIMLDNYDNAFVQLRYTGKIDEKSQLFGLLTKVNNDYYISALKMHCFFKRRIRSVVKRMVRRKHYEQCKTGKLTVNFPDKNKYNAEENGPAWTLPLRWSHNDRDGYRINVDIVPVILISDSCTPISIKTFHVKDLTAQRFMSYPALCSMLGNERYEYTSDVGKMEGGTFTLTYADVMKRVSDENKLFTELSFLTSHVHHENALMKELKNSFQSMFICYQIFKRLEPLWSRIKMKGQLHGLRFHSYILKTIVLDTIINGSENISPHDDVATCFEVILKRIVDLSESCVLGNHESIRSLWFDGHVLTCAKLPQACTYNEEYSHAYRQQFELFIGLLNKVMNDSEYTYFKYRHVILDLIRKQANFRIISYE